MKEENINLLPQKKEEQKIANTFFYVSLGIFLFIFFVGAIIVIFTIVIQTRISSLSFTEKNLRSQIDTVSLKRDKMVLISERVKAIKTVLIARKELSGQVYEMLSQIPDNFNIESINADDTAVTLAMSSPSLSAFDNLFSTVLPKITKDKLTKVSKVDVDSFSRGESGYTLELGLKTGQQSQ